MSRPDESKVGQGKNENNLIRKKKGHKTTFSNHFSLFSIRSEAPKKKKIYENYVVLKKEKAIKTTFANHFYMFPNPSEAAKPNKNHETMWFKKRNEKIK